jgi:hypothetical protein
MEYKGAYACKAFNFELGRYVRIIQGLLGVCLLILGLFLTFAGGKTLIKVLRWIIAFGVSW